MLENIVRHMEMGRKPNGGGAQRLEGDRIHDRFHDAFACGRGLFLCFSNGRDSSGGCCTNFSVVIMMAVLIRVFR